MLQRKVKQGKAGRLTGVEGGALSDMVVREVTFEKRSN